MHEGSPWNREVQYLKYVGPRRANTLKKLGIITVGDLLYHFPRAYEDRSCVMRPSELVTGQTATVRGTVESLEDRRPKRGLAITRIYLRQEREGFVAVWYNQSFIRKRIRPGDTVLVTGKVSSFRGEVQIQVVDYEVENEKDGIFCAGGTAPLYPLTEGLSQRQFRSMIGTALAQFAKEMTEFIPGSILSRYRLPEINRAIMAIHFPEKQKDAEMARRRFIFEELFLYQLLIALIKKNTRKTHKIHRYSRDEQLSQQLISRLPFKLTPGQTAAWQEIKRAMYQPLPMNMLLQGDVGSGKTVVCALAIAAAVGSGFQAALMAPTEILAGQHYSNLKEYLGCGISLGLLTSGVKKSEKKQLARDAENGMLQVLVGTHALIQDDIAFRNLSLVVIDEQHRFGVRQRSALHQKGWLPDVIVTTATPIPRTLAMTIYGDLDASVIRGMPPGRKPVTTRVLTAAESSRAYRHIREEVGAGRQAYIICPLVEESEKVDLQAAVELGRMLVGGPLAGVRLEVLHGRMKAGEKEEIMSRFRCGQTEALISTTVIEVGVDVPNASVMLVIDAQRFGLAQLHQLRGRVGRGGHASYCYLISDVGTEESKARMDAMKSISDGFLLAEKDLMIRGPGDIFGTRQSGDFTFRIADPVSDARVLELASLEARQLVDSDPVLEKPECKLLVRELKERFHNLKLITVG